MREIKFRAKTSSEINGFNHKKDGIWVYGFYRDKLGLPIISEFDTSVGDYIDYEIDRSTLGQYTGLKDKNGKEIYEGDIIKMHYFFDNYDLIIIGAFEDEANLIGIVKCELLDGFYVKDIDDNGRSYLQWVQETTEELEVIGNIYDNPELLEANNE